MNAGLQQLMQQVMQYSGQQKRGAPELDPMTVQSAGQAGLGSDLFKNVGVRTFGQAPTQRDMLAEQDEGLIDPQEAMGPPEPKWWERFDLPGGYTGNPYGDTKQSGLVNSQGWQDWHNL